MREVNAGEKVGFWFMWLNKLVTGQLARLAYPHSEGCSQLPPFCKNDA